ncbi:MAG: FAD-dependent oxidoreductase [Planctomycetes bacterium]|nr:FAD-dependent oxidoreductase [Planctomycetota bacterium]
MGGDVETNRTEAPAPGASRAIVVGGGVIGAACAHYLASAGWSVEVVEQGEFGRGCSHGNCGLIVPSHVLPLPEPGMMRSALKAVFQKNAPLAVKPRLDPAMWMWFFRFALRCNRRAMLEAGRARQALLASSRKLWNELVENERLECEWEERGLLYVYRSTEAMNAFARADQLLREEFNIAAERWDADELAEREPALKPGLAGGWYYREEAQLRPDRLLASWRRRLTERGVVIHEHAKMDGFVHEGGKAEAIVTDRGEFPGHAFVIATGALTPRLAKHLGRRMPIQPGKGYSITMPHPPRRPAMPLIFPETRVAVTPMQTGYRLGSTMEFAGYDATLRRDRLAMLKAGAEPFLIEPWRDPVEEEWFGWRPMTFDGVPIIDRSPRLENVLVAAGHNMEGVAMAPATGKLVAEMLTGKPPHLPPSPYRLTRFGRFA